jgi:hypothetical protein
MFIEMDWSQAVREQGRLSDDAARRPGPTGGARPAAVRRAFRQRRAGLLRHLCGRLWEGLFPLLLSPLSFMPCLHQPQTIPYLLT